MEPSTDVETRELATLLEVARSVASTLELGPLLRLILDHLKVVADYSGSSICVVEGDQLCILESRGATAADREDGIIGVRLPTGRGGVFWRRISRGEPAIIGDIRGASAVARAYRTLVGPHVDSAAIRYVRSFLGVPLLHRDRVIGLLTLSKAEPHYYTPRHARLAMAIATHAAAAIENARLYEEARAAQAGLARQLERLTVLTGITQQLLAATEVDAVLQVVVTAAHRLSETTGAAVGLIDDSGHAITFTATAGEPREYFDRFKCSQINEAFLTGTATGQALALGRPVAVEDYAAWGDPETRHEMHAAAVAQQVRAFVVTPLLVDGAPIGVLRVHDTTPRAFVPEDIALVRALADQAALAIEHARLVRRGRDAAALEERTRLARELHDSVTQSLFSLTMLARAAQTQHERGSEGLGSTLERVGALAQEALVEMRSLLFELHPASLAEQGLSRALDRLVEAMRVRTDLVLTYTATTEARPRPEAELAIFRIVQEALANVAKHADATEVHITVAEDGGWIVVTVADNGVGFDPDAPVARSADGASGGMGLRSMRERAAAVGLALDVTSAPGAGTTIRVAAPPAARVADGGEHTGRARPVSLSE